MVAKKTYNKCIIPDGNIELSLKNPNITVDPANYSYCLQSNHHSPGIRLQCVVVDKYVFFCLVIELANWYTLKYP